MSLAWLTGKMSLKAAVEKHPRWVEKVLNDGDPEKILPDDIRENCRTIDDIKEYIKYGPEFKEKTLVFTAT